MSQRTLWLRPTLPSAAAARVLLTGFAALAALDAIASVTLTLTEVRVHRAWLEAPGTIGRLADSTPGMLTLGALALACAVALARMGWRLHEAPPARRRFLASALGYLVAMGLLDRAFAAAHGTFGGRHYYSGLALGCWATAVALGPWLGVMTPRARHTLGAVAALAGYATLYAAAGVSKVAQGGLGWADASQLRLIVASRMEPGAWNAGLQGLVVDTPALASAFGAAAVVLELGAPLVLLGGRLRRLWALGLIGFHVGVFVLTNIPFATAAIASLVVALAPGRRARDAAEPVVLAHGRGPGRARALGLGLAATLWLVPSQPTLDPIDQPEFREGHFQSEGQGAQDGAGPASPDGRALDPAQEPAP